MALQAEPGRGQRAWEGDRGPGKPQPGLELVPDGKDTDATLHCTQTHRASQLQGPQSLGPTSQMGRLRPRVERGVSKNPEQRHRPSEPEGPPPLPGGGSWAGPAGAPVPSAREPRAQRGAPPRVRSVGTSGHRGWGPDGGTKGGGAEPPGPSSGGHGLCEAQQFMILLAAKDDREDN